jgi:hypothetical protein
MRQGCAAGRVAGVVGGMVGLGLCASAGAQVTVYDNMTGHSWSGYMGQSSNLLEDLRFDGGPWAGQVGRRITQIEVRHAPNFGVPIATEQVLFIVWDEDDVVFTGWSGLGTGMINPAAQPLGSMRVSPTMLAFPSADFTGLPGGGIAVPDDDDGVVLQVAWVVGDCPDLHDLSGCIYGGCGDFDTRTFSFATSTLAALGGNPASIGFTSPSYGRDVKNVMTCPHIGRFIGSAEVAIGGGAPQPGPPAVYLPEHQSLQFGGYQLGLVARVTGAVAPPGCGTADFDGDGDSGTDADIEAFFACLAGGCCATCGSADFDADGDTATDADIEAFFRVLAGGTC